MIEIASGELLVVDHRGAASIPPVVGELRPVEEIVVARILVGILAGPHRHHRRRQHVRDPDAIGIFVEVRARREGKCIVDGSQPTPSTTLTGFVITTILDEIIHRMVHIIFHDHRLAVRIAPARVAAGTSIIVFDDA